MVDSPRLDRFRRGFTQVAAPIGSVILLLILWHGFVRTLQIPVYLLPSPLDVADSFVAKATLLFSNAKPSIYEAVLGFLVSLAVGVPLAVLAVGSSTFGKAVTPILIFSQVVPKVAIAPLLLIWFGFGITSRVLIVFLMAFFPIFMSMNSGLRAIDPDMLYLLNTMRPSQLQVFTKLRIPNSLPFLVDGMKLAATRSVIAAIVAEWISSDKGLGYLLIHADAAIDSPLMFATMVLLALLGLVFFTIISAFARLLVPWHFAMRKTETVRERR